MRMTSASKPFAFGMIGLASISVSCFRPAPGPEAIEEARKTARASLIAGVAAGNGADAEWQEVFKDDRQSRVYTYELQKALVRPNSQPVVLVGPVDDVGLLDTGQYEVRTRQAIPRGPTIYFSLRCGEDRLKAVFTPAPRRFSLLPREFAIVATISRISAPMFTSLIDPYSAPDYFGPEIGIEPGVAIATGTCSEIIRIDVD